MGSAASISGVSPLIKRLAFQRRIALALYCATVASACHGAVHPVNALPDSRPRKPAKQGIAFIPRKEKQGNGQRCPNQVTTESTVSRDRDRRRVRPGTRRARLMQYAQVRLQSTESSRPAGTAPSTACAVSMCSCELARGAARAPA
jgi:hypothetical protein